MLLVMSDVECNKRMLMMEEVYLDVDKARVSGSSSGCREWEGREKVHVAPRHYAYESSLGEFTKPICTRQTVFFVV